MLVDVQTDTSQQALRASMRLVISYSTQLQRGTFEQLQKTQDPHEIQDARKLLKSRLALEPSFPLA